MGSWRLSRLGCNNCRTVCSSLDMIYLLTFTGEGFLLRLVQT